jgi:hypothetical protein
MQSKRFLSVSAVLLVLIAAASTAPPARAQKLKAEELIAKHLQSLGAADKVKATKSRVTSGAAQVAFRVGGAGNLSGKGNILSSGNASRMGFLFSALDYPGEQIAFDGSKVSTGYVSPGNRSPLSNFVYENDVLLKEGLLFGSLSTSWALLDVAAKQPKLDSNGLKKIDGRQLHELKYQAKRGNGNVQAFLYFDPETFRHVRSQFKVEVPLSKMTNITDSAELARYLIVEQFEEFKEVDGLMLPHSYKLDYTIDSPRGGILTGWTFVIDRITHNEPIERQLFSVQ